MKTYQIIFDTNILVAALRSKQRFKIIPDPYLEERAKRATGKGLSTVLSNVDDIPPENYDKLQTEARYILEDEEIRYYLKIPNEITLEALAEDKNNMPVFNTIEGLREDLYYIRKNKQFEKRE